jgi:(p)ppGpp synthase/HD superfamily hydrolase
MTERADLMAVSVASAAASHGLPPEAVETLRRSLALAMAPRVETLDDDHHPAYLHPGRTVLVLLQDVGDVPLTALCAAALHETEDGGLRVSVDGVRAALGDEVADLLAALPQPGAERLVERLVTLDRGSLLASLAERLDQLRHAHLREDRDWWHAIYEEAGAVWVPVAERTHPRLADRYRHWHRTFGRRLDRS